MMHLLTFVLRVKVEARLKVSNAQYLKYLGLNDSFCDIANNNDTEKE